MVHSVRTIGDVGGTKRNDMILHYLIRSWKIERSFGAPAGTATSDPLPRLGRSPFVCPCVGSADGFDRVHVTATTVSGSTRSNIISYEKLRDVGKTKLMFTKRKYVRVFEIHDLIPESISFRPMDITSPTNLQSLRVSLQNLVPAPNGLGSHSSDKGNLAKVTRVNLICHLIQVKRIRALRSLAFISGSGPKSKPIRALRSSAFISAGCRTLG